MLYQLSYTPALEGLRLYRLARRSAMRDLLGSVRPRPARDVQPCARPLLNPPSGPFQPAVATALDLPDDYFTTLATDFRARRDRLASGLDALGFGVTVPGGGYFVTTDVRPVGIDDGMAFCRDLPEHVGVAAIPHEVFWDDPADGRHLVRWSFAKQDAVLDEGLRRLQSLDRLPRR